MTATTIDIATNVGLVLNIVVRLVALALFVGAVLTWAALAMGA